MTCDFCKTENCGTVTIQVPNIEEDSFENRREAIRTRLCYTIQINNLLKLAKAVKVAVFHSSWDDSITRGYCRMIPRHEWDSIIMAFEEAI